MDEKLSVCLNTLKLLNSVVLSMIEDFSYHPTPLSFDGFNTKCC